jgi:hypothetical protein
MTKLEALTNFIRSVLPTEEHILLHNAYCERNHYDTLVIHPMDWETVNMVFKTPSDFLEAIRKNPDFNSGSKYFQVNDSGAIITCGMLCTSDLLAEFLISWGDAGLTLTGIDNYLENAFKEYVKEVTGDRIRVEALDKAVDEAYEDYLMNDWDDIIQDMFGNVLGFCPECHSGITRECKVDFDYDTGRTMYRCPECDHEFFL